MDSEDDSELDLDDETVFGITDLDAVTSSVGDVTLADDRAALWTLPPDATDSELNSPSLSPQTLLSSEQLDSLRVDRGLRGLHNPVAAAAARNARDASNCALLSPGSSDSGDPSSPRRGSRELHELGGVPLRGAVGFGPSTVDDVSGDALSSIGSGSFGACEERRLSRKDSDNDTGTLV